MDGILVATGIGLVLYAVVMALAYLILERGSILDPITISWVGFAVCIGVAMISTGVMFPQRPTVEYGTQACFLAVMAVGFYTLGLFLGGKAFRFCAKLPRPHLTPTKGQIWFAWSISALLLGIFFLSWQFLFDVIGKTAGLPIYACVISMSVLCVTAFLVLRGAPLTKLFMILSAIAGCLILLEITFSRRPLTGVAMAAAGLIYHFRIAKKPLLVKAGYMSALAVAVFILIAYLGATRDVRIYGEKIAGRSSEVFGEKNLFGFLFGIEVTHRVYEFTLEQIPIHHNYLYGSGYANSLLFFVPRALWPDKPVATSYTISQLYLNVEDIYTNFGINPVAELYANFGYLGIPIGMFLAGRIVRIINTYVRQNTDNMIVWAAWLMVVPDFASEWRGDFNGMTVVPMLQMSAFVIVLWLGGRIFKPRASAQRMSVPRTYPTQRRLAPDIR